MDSLHIDVHLATRIFSSIPDARDDAPIGVLRDATTQSMRYEPAAADAADIALTADDIPVYMDTLPADSRHPYLLKIVTDTRGVMQLQGMKQAGSDYLPLEIITESDG